MPSIYDVIGKPHHSIYDVINKQPPALLFDPVSVGIPPIQEADPTEEDLKRARRAYIESPAISSGLGAALGGIDKAAEVIDKELPELKHITRQIRRFARAGLQVASLPGVVAESIAFPETVIGEKAEEPLGVITPEIASRVRLAGGFLRDMIRMSGGVRVQLQREVELLIDPKSKFIPTAREDIPFPLQPLADLETLLIGEQTFKEAQLRAVATGEEAPEELLFGLGIGKQIVGKSFRLGEALQKVKERPPTRIGETTEPSPFSPRIELEEGKSIGQISEQFMKQRDIEKSMGFTSEEISNLTRKKPLATQFHPDPELPPAILEPLKPTVETITEAPKRIQIGGKGSFGEPVSNIQVQLTRNTIPSDQPGGGAWRVTIFDKLNPESTRHVGFPTYKEALKGFDDIVKFEKRGEIQRLSNDITFRHTATPKEQAKFNRITKDIESAKVETFDATGKPTVETKGVPVEPTPERPTPVLNNARITESLQLLKVDQLPPEARKALIKTTEEALINKYDQDALTIARSINKSDRIPNAAEQVGAGIWYAEKKVRSREMLDNIAEMREKGNEHQVKLELERYQALKDEMLDVATAMRYGGGTGVARSLQVRQMFIPEDFELSNVLLDAEVIKGRPLVRQETLKLTTEVELHDQIQRGLDKAIKEWQDGLSKTDKQSAEGIINRETKRAARTKITKVKRAKILTERVDIIKQISELGENRLNDITGVSVEAAYLVGRLAINYAREAVLTLSEIIAKVRNDFPQLSEMDVIKAINTKNPALQGKARSEATQRVAQIRTQARLLEAIEKAQRGVFDKPNKRPPTPKEIRVLQKILTELRKEAYRSNLDGRKLERAIQTINELKDQLTGKFRPLRKRKPIDPEELQSAKKKIKELQRLMRIEDALADIKEQLRTGDFKIPEKRPEAPVSVQRQQVELKRQRRIIREIQEQLEEGGRAGRFAREVVNLPRTLQATADISATFRQALVPNVHLVRKGQFKKLIGAHQQAIRAFFSENTADMIDNAIRQSDNHYLREKAGLYIAERGAAKVSLREEHFMSKVAEKIPVFGEIVKASDRHMTSSLNLLRVAMFDGFLEKFPNATPIELKAWADYVNAASGRGSLGTATNAASWVLFSPRFAASRFQTPYKLIKYSFGKTTGKHFRKLPRVRNEIAKDMGAFIGLGSMTLVLAELAGAKVGVFPGDPDFGKIVIRGKDGKKTEIDIWGGYIQFVRFMIRQALVPLDRIGLTGRDIPASEKRARMDDMMWMFARFKASPAVNMGFELLEGKTIFGEPISPTQVMMRGAVPLAYKDIIEAYKVHGLGMSITSAGLGAVGFGANTYADSEFSTRKAVRRLFQAGKVFEARQRAKNWNLLNPNNRIVNITVVKGGNETSVNVAQSKNRKVGNSIYDVIGER